MATVLYLIVVCHLWILPGISGEHYLVLTICLEQFDILFPQYLLLNLSFQRHPMACCLYNRIITQIPSQTEHISKNSLGFFSRSLVFPECSFSTMVMCSDSLCTLDCLGKGVLFESFLKLFFRWFFCLLWFHAYLSGGKLLLFF